MNGSPLLRKLDREQSDSSGPLLGCLACLGVLAIIPFLAIWRGYVLSITWAWLIVKPFGVIPLNIPQAIAIAWTIAFLTNQELPQLRDEVLKPAGERCLASLFSAAFGPAIFLLGAFVLKHYL
jgi:hypothetical protein